MPNANRDDEDRLYDLRDIKPFPENYRQHPKVQIDLIRKGLRQFRQYKNLVLWRDPADGQLYSLVGHAVIEAALQEGWTQIRARERSDLSRAEARTLVAYDNQSALLALDDQDDLSQLIASIHAEDAKLAELAASGQEELQRLLKLAGQEPMAEDAEIPLSRAEELQEKWNVRLGDLFLIPSLSVPGKEHRIVCGDCTDASVATKMMRGDKASLCLSDPPYGMGKESEGIANDNLYREKLDAFQMAWWRACRPLLENNASAYIWGNAEDLWRLWYCGGLRDSERLTLRNEIVWVKTYRGMGTPDAMGQKSELRSFAVSTERCLFFMLGEQGFSTNADNYWEGWEPVRKYLEDSRKAMGWDIPTMKRIVGHSDLSRDHWTGKSQWSFPTREVYEKLQVAARDDAFKREYDALKRECDAFKREYDDLKRGFYATRAYFDNSHDNMTDVWQFERVQGEERWEIATPKPLPIMERIIKSSTPAEAIVLDPFLGSGTTICACELTGRLGRGCEIHPPYVSVCLERLSQMGLVPVLSDS